jgi:hypothetical protein
MKMFGGVFILRGITAADVAAVHTQSEVHPLIAGFQTLLASMRVRNDFLDLGQMCTLVHNSNVHPKETWGQTSKSPKSQYLVCPRISFATCRKHALGTCHLRFEVANGQHCALTLSQRERVSPAN